jgi:integrase
MARKVERLTALKVEKAKRPGMYADGAGLYLQVTSEGAKSWIYRFSLNGKAREMGLGSLSALGLADARAEAATCRRLRQGGIDPIEARKAERAERKVEAAKATTFKQAAESYISAHRAGWRNAKHASQWQNTLATYAYPLIGELPIHTIDTDLVLKVLQQEVIESSGKAAVTLWQAKPETAGRLRGRMEAILDAAKARGVREGENPARWRGHLDHMLPPKAKVRRVKHHPALPYAELPAFIEALRAQEGVAARALEFSILTAARTNETIRAVSNEIDGLKKLWTVPGDRMKAGREHRVPLSARALAILEAPDLRTAESPFLFPGGKQGEPLSNMAMTETLRRMNEARAEAGLPRFVDPRQGRAVTVHGFRSTFRDWAAECTNYPNEVVEMALAHVVGDETEAAYGRGELLEKRRRLMADWESFSNTPRAATAGDNVVALRAGRA